MNDSSLPPCPFSIGDLVKVPEWARPLAVGEVIEIEFRRGVVRSEGVGHWLVRVDFGKGKRTAIFLASYAKPVDPVEALGLIT